LRLARMSGCDLLEVVFARSKDGARAAWMLSGANPIPVARGEQEVAAIVDLLESRAYASKERACV
jgi:hypothetical protein